MTTASIAIATHSAPSQIDPDPNAFGSSDHYRVKRRDVELLVRNPLGQIAETAMPRYVLIILVILLTAIGCSSSTDTTETPVQQAKKVITEAASSLAMSNSGEKTDEEPATEEQIAPFEDNLDIFSPPELDLRHVVDQTEEEEEEIDIKGEPPRLVGFINVGSMKAMLSVGNKPVILGAGDYYKGFEVVTVEPPLVTLKHGFHQFDLNLFKQSPRPRETSRSADTTDPPSSDSDQIAEAPPKIPGVPALGGSVPTSTPTELPPPEGTPGDDFSFPGIGEDEFGAGSDEFDIGGPMIELE